MTTYTYDVTVSGGEYVLSLQGGSGPETAPALSGLLNDVFIFNIQSSTVFNGGGNNAYTFSLSNRADENGFGGTEGVVYVIDGTTYNTYAAFVSAYEALGATPTAATATLTISNTSPSKVFYWSANHNDIGNSITLTGFPNRYTYSIPNVRGPQGVQGPAGPTGPQGAEGPQGPTGAAGSAGGAFHIAHVYGSYAALVGDSDPPSNVGISTGQFAIVGGSTSATEYGYTYLYKGSGNGDVGTNNAWQFVIDIPTQGVQGPTGPTGPQGSAGSQGATGSQGPTGADGRGISTIVLGTHPTDSNKYRLTITFDDVAGTQTAADFVKPADGVDGTTPKEISSTALGTDPNNAANYALTITYDDASTDVVTFAKPADGVDGATGPGFTGGSYSASTGVVTFSSNDGLGFTTGDLRGATGSGFTGGSYSASTGVVTFSSNDGLGFTTGDLRGADGIGAVDSVNGNTPDVNGNVTLTIPASGTDFDPAGTALALSIALG